MYCRVQYNSRPLAIFQPSDAADRLIQPMVGHLCQSIVFAAIILNCWSIIMLGLSDIIVLAIYYDILKVSISQYFHINYRDTIPVHYFH